ncbi:MAG: NADH:flavin oxidoreductase/NADH oxidase [Gallionella sp.]|jgi:2,4-dienoyl-CoA reductase-like NADH-dependent reductase (Old Yellow Enzyme family)
MAHLFEPLKLRDIVLSNRIGIPPMCQYSAQDGMAADWHFVHYGSRAVGGAALMIVEATAVTPEGRISPGDLGIWDDRHIEPLARIVRFSQAQGCVTAIQLAHAGRKASVGLGWQAQSTLSESEGGWTVVAPSPVSFGEDYVVPCELDEAAICQVIARFAAGASRALAAGFQAVEIHAAHGYLLHQFLSPLSNLRTDRYGGSFENRTRLVREVVAAVRAVWSERLPLLIRLSATDWVDGGWSADETVELCRGLKEMGVDLVDVSSAGLLPAAKIPAGPGFQTEFAARVRREAGVPTAAVGLITSPAQADHIIRSGQADMVLLGREMLRNPYWPLSAAQALGQAACWPVQYLRAGPPGSTGR